MKIRSTDCIFDSSFKKMTLMDIFLEKKWKYFGLKKLSKMENQIRLALGDDVKNWT